MSARIIPIQSAQNGIAAAEKMSDLGETAVAQAYIALVYCMAAWTGSERGCGERKCSARESGERECGPTETRHVVRFRRAAISRIAR
jgi:hypothetical protein